MTFDADLTACAQMVQKADPDRFAAVMASPLAARYTLFPLYAFSIEVSRAPWVTQEPMIAEMRLQWWRDALEEIANGAAVRRHEVVTPLTRVLDVEDARLLDRMVAARRWDIYKDAFEDAAHFNRYIEETAGILIQVAARALARQGSCQETLSSAAEEAVLKLGQAHGFARFLQAIPDLEARGRVPLVDGRVEAISARAEEVLGQCPSRKELRRLLPRALWPATTEAFQALYLLRQAATQPMRVAEGTLALHPVVRSWCLWRWS
ncbi:MAG: squalene/phytoene synthase family protein [Roseobacter sp.]